MNKKLIISVLTLVLAFALAGTTTFAWFTMNSTVKVETLDINVTADNGILISTTKDGTYKTTLTTADMDALVGTTKLDARTPKDVAPDAGTLDFVDVEEADATDGYLEFSVWIRSGAAEDVKVTSITFTSTSGGNESIAKWWTASDTEDAISTAGLEAAGVVTAAQAKDAACLYVNGAGNDFIYTGAQTEGFSQVAAVNAAHSYYEYIHGAAPAITTFGDTYANMTLVPSSTLPTDTTFTTAVDGDYFYKEIKMVLWLEGTDADCFDYLINDSLSVAIVFDIA